MMTSRKIINNISLILYVFCTQACINKSNDIQGGLIGHWPLIENGKDVSGNERHAETKGNLRFRSTENETGAVFNGRNSWLEIPAERSPQLGKESFSFSVWIYNNDQLDDVPGDIVSQYDLKQRKGFELNLKSNAVTTSHANDRHLTFWIDDNETSKWTDVGKPGNALAAFSLAEFDGNLYAGTCEVALNEKGHVYRYDGVNNWVDYGSPDLSNSVMALAVYQDALYAGTGKYRVSGSSLPESENMHLGGRIFRLAEKNEWIDCGQLPGVETVGGMLVYKGDLYASSLYSPGFFKYAGDSTWIDCGTPDNKRVVAMAIYNGYLYATSYDSGNIYRYDGTTWEDCGLVGKNTQVYSFTVYEGKLYSSSWPSGRVYRFEDINSWTDVGRLGNELEVMGMLVHKGRLLGGTLPLAEIYSYEGDTTWRRIEQIDKTPEVKYRRAWTMAEHDGKVFCTTLPSGKIYKYDAGKSAFFGKTLKKGWHHIVATKSKDRLQLYVDGVLVSKNDLSDTKQFDLSNESTFKIGFGTNDYFMGQMRDLRLYSRVLNQDEIDKLKRDQGRVP